MLLHRSQLKWLLFMLTIVVWGSAAIIGTKKVRLAAKAPVTIELTTKPARVRVQANGQAIFKDRYVTTPVKWTMPPGTHRVKISREGFITQKIEVEGRAGNHFKMDSVVLGRKASLAAARLIIRGAATEDKIYFEIGDGHTIGETPFQDDSIVPGVTHQLKVFPNGQGKQPYWSCKFKISPKRPKTDPYIIKLFVTKQNLRVSGCKRLTRH